MPDCLKISVIKPIEKKVNPTCPSHFRPIALLSTLAKIFETAMSNRLASYCEKYSIFNDSQNGFRKKRNTSLALFKYINEILNIINNKKYAIGILLDMSKAYDKVPYNILLKKLHGIGVRGTAHKWFQSYLSNRKQYVQLEYHNSQTGMIENVQSEVECMTGSIPQGSVLGCILFLIYINDLPKVIDVPSILYADDISLVFPYHTNDGNISPRLNAIITCVSNWLSSHNLEINFTKTKIIQFRPYQKQHLDINFTYNHSTIECINSTKLLGLQIDSNLSWKDHIHAVSTKLSRFTYALREIKISTDLHTAKSSYFAYAHAWLLYGIILWGNSTDVHDLFVLQKKCVRILANIKQTQSCRPHFGRLKILTLPSLYIMEASKFYRMHRDLFPEQGTQNCNNLRPRNRLNLPVSKLKMFKSGPYSMCIKIFNNLPLVIKNEPNYNRFLKQMISFLLEKCFYTVQEFLECQS